MQAGSPQLKYFSALEIQYLEEKGNQVNVQSENISEANIQVKEKR